MREIQIYEVEGTNLLFVVTDRNSDASYYSKTNLRVEAVDGYVIIWNEDVQFFRELPKDFVEPLESSVVDLVEIIQGYINNIIPANEDELNALKELLTAQKETNTLIEILTASLYVLNSVDINQKITNKILVDAYSAIMPNEEDLD